MALPGAVTSFLTLMHALTDRGGVRPELVVQQDVASIAAPTLFVTGSESFFDRPGHAAAIARSMPDARCVVLDGAGHFTWLDEPAAVGALVAEHFAAI